MNEESKTIDNTMQKFSLMKYDIESLTGDMKNILSSTKEVVSFNENIMKHSEQLSASTEEVSAFAEEALNIMEDNRRKTLEAKEIMFGILDVANQLV